MTLTEGFLQTRCLKLVLLSISQTHQIKWQHCQKKKSIKFSTTCHRGSTSVAVIKFIIYQKSKVRDYCSFLGYLITVNYKVLALHTVNHFKSSKINIEFEI